MPQSFVLMCGDTSGSVEDDDYTISNMSLTTTTPEPASMSLLLLGAGSHLLAK